MGEHGAHEAGVEDGQQCCAVLQGGGGGGDDGAGRGYLMKASQGQNQVQLVRPRMHDAGVSQENYISCFLRQEMMGIRGRSICDEGIELQE